MDRAAVLLWNSGDAIDAPLVGADTAATYVGKDAEYYARQRYRNDLGDLIHREVCVRESSADVDRETVGTTGVSWGQSAQLSSTNYLVGRCAEYGSFRVFVTVISILRSCVTACASCVMPMVAACSPLSSRVVVLCVCAVVPRRSPGNDGGPRVYAGSTPASRTRERRPGTAAAGTTTATTPTAPTRETCL